MIDFDPDRKMIDLFCVDGASNVQKAGEAISAVFPRCTTIHGAEHLLSLFFSDIAKIPTIKVQFCF